MGKCACGVAGLLEQRAKAAADLRGGARSALRAACNAARRPHAKTGHAPRHSRQQAHPFHCLIRMHTSPCQSRQPANPFRGLIWMHSTPGQNWHSARPLPLHIQTMPVWWHHLQIRQRHCVTLFPDQAASLEAVAHGGQPTGAQKRRRAVSPCPN